MDRRCNDSTRNDVWRRRRCCQSKGSTPRNAYWAEAQAPTPRAVGEYLKEFLMDPYVIDIPFIFRWILVHFLIVPRRSRASALLYEKIWTSRGSPLLFHTEDLTAKLQKKLGPSFHIEFGMRYGSHFIASALREFKKRGIKQVNVVPLYPQYSLAATESV